MLQRDRDNLRGEIQTTEEAHSKEKQTLVEEIVNLKKMKDLADLQVSQREMEILKSKQELERELVSLTSSEQKIYSLQSQIKQRLEQQKSIESQLSDKRMDLLKVNSAKQEMEEKLHKHTAAVQDHIALDLRNEISFLHQQLRETDLQSEQDRVLRSKIMADCVSLTSENNALHTRILELNKQLEIQRALKEDNYPLDSSSFAQLLSVKDRDEHLNKQVKQQQELLELEKIRFKDLMKQIGHLQSGNKLQDLNTATIRSCIDELQAVLAKEQQINTELRRDKHLLVDHVTNLQNQIMSKDAELLHISSRIEDLESHMSSLKSDQELHRSLQSERWKGISNMAGSMKNLSMPLTGASVSFEK
ncbi:golgin subfamily B member 1-like [Spea bombifrons]|uniref:golgin subfamily B member 1-like n=1 Tax=Spea bombifrons TaxID=233779 RepID=UPI00234922C4|nr:golgin subfamily B member 1-like [Spea bombifrons]